MKFGKTLMVVFIPLLLSGCAALKTANIGNEFDKSSKDYLTLLRWQEFESALGTYVSVPQQEEYRRKLKETGEVKIVDYRVKREVCDPVRGEATVVAELDYYRPPSVTVKTVVDNQKWVYEGEDDKRSWRLTTPLPDLR